MTHKITKIHLEELEKYYIINIDGTIDSKLSNRRLKGSIATTGYKKVNAKYFDGSKWLAVHRIVATKYVNGETSEKRYVNHKDGDKLNNHADNLEWCTHKENIDHAYNTGLVKEDRTKRHYNSDRDRVIIFLLENGFKLDEVAKAFELSITRIIQIRAKYKDMFNATLCNN